MNGEQDGESQNETPPVDPALRGPVAPDAPRSRWLAAGPLLLAVALGSLAGVGGYTFRYAEGFSYFKTDPEACANCHIMQRQYDGWLRSSHHAAAVCVDCHLPQAFIPKYLAKAENGWRHGKLFTTQTFREPIEVQAAGRKILQANCERCHQDLVDSMTQHGDGSIEKTESASLKPSCVHCHWAAGHGERAALGGPMRQHQFDQNALGNQSDIQPMRLSE